jgi:hypothetical protein
VKIKSFFGKIRRKILRIILGKDLFLQLTSIKDKNEELKNVIRGRGNESENFIQAKIDESQNFIQAKIDESQNFIQAKIDESQNNILKRNNTFFNESHNYFNELIKHIHESKTIKEINTKTFVKYRNINKKREIVIMGAGPTLKYYEPVENCINIGTNGTVLYDNVKLDYLFVQDVNAMNRYEKEIVNYDCKKFMSFWGSFIWTLPLKYKNIQNMEEYCSYSVGHISSTLYNFNGDYASHSIPLDICNAPLSDFNSVIFPAVQFALWTYPKRIYVVGCDCSYTGKYGDGGVHFNDSKEQAVVPVDELLQGWYKIKEFQQIYYPDIEMISINPVFLKGLFKDEFTDSYLKDNPDAGKS